MPGGEDSQARRPHRHPRRHNFAFQLQARGLTQEQVGKELGVKQQTLSDWLTGYAPSAKSVDADPLPDAATLDRIAKAIKDNAKGEVRNKNEPISVTNSPMALAMIAPEAEKGAPGKRSKILERYEGDDRKAMQEAIRKARAVLKYKPLLAQEVLSGMLVTLMPRNPPGQFRGSACKTPTRFSTPECPRSRPARSLRCVISAPAG